MSSTARAQQGGPPASSWGTNAAASCISADKKFVFGSEWYFHPEGIKSLLVRFNTVLSNKKLGAQVEWSESDATFRISCDNKNADEIWEIFLKTVKELIAQELGIGVYSAGDESDSDESMVNSDDDESKPTNSNKIQLLIDWQKQNGITQPKDESEGDRTDGSIAPYVFPPIIKAYKSKFIWEYQTLQPSLDEIAPDELLAKLERLVDCKFFKDLDQSKIFIGGTSEEECLRATCKLDVVRKSWRPRAPLTKHLFYTEELENYQVSFKSIVDIRKKFFETTLLDNFQLNPARFNYHNLPSAVTVRCDVFNVSNSRYMPVRAPRYRPVIDFDDRESKFGIWPQNFTYSCRIPAGKEEQNAMTRFETHIEQELPAQQAGNLAREVNSSSQSLSNLELSLAAHREEETSRWALVQEQASPSTVAQTDYDASISEHLFSCAIQPKIKSCTLSKNSSEQEQRPAWDTYVPYSVDQFDRKKNKARIQNVQVGVRLSTPPHISPEKFAETPLSERLGPDGPQLSHPIEGGSSNQRTVSDGIAAHVHASLSLIDLDENMAVSGSRPAQSIFDDPFGSPPRLLLNYPVLEATQRVDEVRTRTFYSTMNQKMGKPSKNSTTQASSRRNPFAGRLEPPGPPPRQPVPKIPENDLEPTPQFISGIKLRFGELLQGLRGFRGKLNLQAEFGRLLLKDIPHRFIARENSERSMEPEVALAILEDPKAPSQAVFTKLLTVLPADITYLVEMKDRKGDFIWKQAQDQQICGIFYEILCVDYRQRRPRAFTIEIDGENFSYKVKIRRDFGAINVHGVKRRWDFRVSATGIEATDETDPAYEEFAKVLMDSLHIPEGSSMPLIFFEIPDSFAHFRVFSVRVRRIHKRRSLNEESMLNVYEVRELQLHDADSGNCTMWKAVGVQEPDTMITAQDYPYKWLYLWHEISISCPRADDLFEQNKTLELGEEAAWDSKKLSEVHTLQSLYLPACEMLQQIDGVGFYNDNEVDAETIQSMSRCEEEAEPYYFW